jgi:hypothetical protein
MDVSRKVNTNFGKKTIVRKPTGREEVGRR